MYANRITRTSLRIAVVTLLSALLTGCGGRTVKELVFDKGPVTEAWAVDVNSFAGGVEVVADPAAPGIEVRATLRAGHDWYRVGKNIRQHRLEQTLDRINVEAELIRDSNGFGILQVTAVTDYEYPDLQWVDLRITMPEVNGARVQTMRGTVDLLNLDGAITVINERGDVMIRSSKALTEAIAASTTEGNVNLRIPPDSSGEFDLEALGGAVEFKAYEGAPIIHSRGEERVTARYNGGGNLVVLRAYDGKVRVVIKDDPTAVGPFNY